MSAGDSRRRCTAAFRVGQCLLWVINVEGQLRDPAPYVRFASKSGHSSRVLGMSALYHKRHRTPFRAAWQSAYSNVRLLANWGAAAMKLPRRRFLQLAA